jgi:hypothetical protein
VSLVATVFKFEREVVCYVSIYIECEARKAKFNEGILQLRRTQTRPFKKRVEVE